MDTNPIRPAAPPTQPQGAGQAFVKKTVDTPILDVGLREKINGSQNFSSNEGVAGFYQANKIYFWAIIIGVVMIAGLAYWAFKKPAPTAPKEANVEVKVDFPETVPTGGEAVYKVILKNNDSQTLVSGELELVYPEGVSYVSSVPNAEGISGTQFKVPDLVSGQNATVIVKTKVTGNVNDEKKLSLKFHYRLSNFNSDFIKDQFASLRLVAADVLVELQGPAAANNGQIVVYTAKYQNNSDNDVSNARIKLNYPQGFVFASAQPAPDIGSDTWNIGTLAKGGSGQISISGSFNSVNPGESKTASADFVVLDSAGQAKVQNSSEFVTAISSLPLLVSQDLEPSRADGVIKPGDNLTFRIRYQNNGSTVASGVNIAVTLDSRVVDLGSLRAEGGQINNNTITWNASSVQNLENLAPNESGQLSFSLQINNPAVKDSSKNLTLVSNIKIKSSEANDFYPGNTLSLKVSSPSKIESDLSFVSGQLPPKVGLSCVYKVKLALSNSTNDYSNGKLPTFQVNLPVLESNWTLLASAGETLPETKAPGPSGKNADSTPLE
jgi:hypothetical protein